METEWEAKETTDGHFGIYPADDGDCIGVIWNTDEAKDNARLIAAAPLLLEASKAVKPVLHRYKGWDQYEQLEAALTAAKGE